MSKLKIALIAASTNLIGLSLTACTSPTIKANGVTTTNTITQQSVQARNKANVLAFYDLVFNQHKVQEATDKYIGKTYLQHNPTVADGGQAFVKAFTPFLKEHPQSKAKIYRVVAEDDLVMLHVHSTLDANDKGEAVVDIFRLDNNGKIVEHWDVIQAVPEKTASGHTIF